MNSSVQPGLGLAISNKMIKLLGGEISVTSKKNQGSKFSFALVFPVCSPPLDTLEPPAKRQRRLSATEKNVLIVEDNVLNQKILANYLQQRGCLCRMAQNGAEAVELSSQFDFDIIMMDVEMPVMNVSGISFRSLFIRFVLGNRGNKEDQRDRKEASSQTSSNRCNVWKRQKGKD